MCTCVIVFHKFGNNLEETPLGIRGYITCQGWGKEVNGYHSEHRFESQSATEAQQCDKSADDQNHTDLKSSAAVWHKGGW